MSKIIATYGKSGAGKSTFSVNLAAGLAENQYVVTLISAELNHGSLQIFFNEKVPDDQGIFAALHDKTEQPQNKLTPCKYNKNLFFLAVPNMRSEVFYEGVEQHVVEDMLRRLGVYCDYIIVDCTSDLSNPLTLMGLHLADHVFCLYRPTIESCLWHQSMNSFFHQFGLSPEPIINAFNIGCSVQEFIKLSGINTNIYLPEVENATLLENVGRPIYSERDRDCKKYKAEIDSIINKITE